MLDAGKESLLDSVASKARVVIAGRRPAVREARAGAGRGVRDDVIRAALSALEQAGE